MNIDKVIKKESDRKLFHLLYRMPEYNSLFYTDDISYIVGIHKNLSWIWTKENISLENIKEIVKILKNKNIKEITCKDELYITISKLLEIKNINKINYYECTNINNKKRVGTIFKITYKDKLEVAKLWQESELDRGNKISINDALLDIEYFMNNDFYINKDEIGNVVSIAGFTINNSIAKITHVYTKKDKRNQGYASYLVSYLASNLLKNKNTCILYTESNNYNAKYLYENLGYIKKDTLIEFNISY